MQRLSVAYLFEDIPHFERVVNDPRFVERFEEIVASKQVGIKVLGFSARRRPQPLQPEGAGENGPDDLKGLEIRVQNNPVEGTVGSPSRCASATSFAWPSSGARGCRSSRSSGAAPARRSLTGARAASYTRTIMPPPLEGLRVVDLTENLAGPFCTMILADMGADVVKVERPGIGDESRRFPPFVDGESAGYLTLHRGKRSVVLDLKDARGREAFHRLVGRADVLVEAFRPGTLDRLGLGAGTLRQAYPRLIVCSLSGFGQTGPYRERGGYDLIAQAMGGLMSVTGEPGRPPAKCGLPVTDMGCGMWAAIGILLALRARDATGAGQWVDTSLFEVPLAWGSWHAARYFATGEVVGPLGSAHPSAAPYQAFQGADGRWFVLSAGAQHLWERLCKLVDRPDLIADPRFATNASRVEHAKVIEAELEGAFRRRPAAEWVSACEAEGIPAGPVNSLAQAFADPQARAREMLVELEHPTAGRHRVLGIPVKLSATPGAIRGPAPRLGQHTEEVLRELGYPAEEARALADAERPRPREAS